jgi:hypothetical protein
MVAPITMQYVIVTVGDIVEMRTWLVELASYEVEVVRPVYSVNYFLFVIERQW